MADEENKSKFMDILARGAEGAVDGIARKSPVIGGALQAIVNTDEYKDRQDQKRYAQEQRDYGRQQMAFEQRKMAEYDKNAPVRDAQSTAAMKTALASAMQSDEYMGADAQKARSTAREAQIAENELSRDKARLGRQMIWQQGKDNYIGNVTQDVINYYANDPNCNMSIPEITGMANSRAVQQCIEGQYYLDKLMKIGIGDKDAFDEIDSELNQIGWDTYFDDNNVLYLRMGKENPMPVTKESMHMVGQYMAGNMRNEMASRDAVSLGNSLGSADKMFNRKYIMDAANKFTGGSYSQAQKYVEGFTNKATPGQAAWARLRQAYDDLGDPSIPITAKMDELANSAQSLKDLGFAVQGFDPKDPMTIMGASILDGSSGRTMTLQQFGDLCKQNDTLSRDIENGINENALRVAGDNIKAAVRNVKETGKEASGEESAEDREQKAWQDSLARQSKQLWGADYAGLDDEARTNAHDALDVFNTFKMQYLKDGMKDNDLSLNDLKDLESAWERIAKAKGLKLSFPLKSILSAKQTAKDQADKHERDTIAANQRVARERAAKERFAQDSARRNAEEREERQARAYENEEHTPEARRRRAREAFENAEEINRHKQTSVLP